MCVLQEKKPAPTPPVAAEKKEKAKVTFEYKAENDDELTINVGEMVEVLDKNTDQDGWWKVRVHGISDLLLLPCPLR